ncbi:MAG TPA: methyltransferase domain-containing protein [Candidatus Dormibacteraeota bacterium]|jgi:SAM-dependent methyltransferase|nr:methyltransferase domain-containing protein [Candidatus Dormibacteraeota bacterium]
MSERWAKSGGPRGEDYDRRYEIAEATGQDVHGEADFVLRFGPRTVLDAGCGTGRVARELARRGVAVVGVDLDARMLEPARRKAPDLEWIEGDLAGLDLRDPEGRRRRFDLILLAGNVMIFLDPGSELTVLRSLTQHLNPGGRLVAGFSLGGELGQPGYDQLTRMAGLELLERWSTWDRAAWQPEGTYCLSVHRLPVEAG